ncbi:MAG: DNA adenine methylase [Bacteroidales bacterium]|nr:DNA adenine methylase [Bacteroidales bacterium]
MQYGNIQPVIKWSGSKRSQAVEIIKQFPDVIDTYYEPFCGGLSVGINLMLSGKKVNRYVFSDTDKNLISLWKWIKVSPDEVAYHYRKRQELMDEFAHGDVAKMKEYYSIVRNTFNTYNSSKPLQDCSNPDGKESYNPSFDFMFLNRTCFNGLIRYNSNSEFNTPFHLNRKGIEPDKFGKIVKKWSEFLNKNNTEFICCDFMKCTPSENDFVYLDPPYANTKGMYGEAFDNHHLFKWMENLNCPYALSYDGISGDENHTFEVPERLYDEKLSIKSGNSSFKRLKTENKHADVYESLYVRRTEH